MQRDGVLIIDKPEGITSRQVVSGIKRSFKAEKAGHTGTLDPLATGLLIVCLGRATLLSRVLSGGMKIYEVKAALGVATDTYDIDGKVVAEKSTVDIKPQDLENSLKSFVGVISQRPPVFSAVKHQGKPLYYYARKGKKVTAEPRDIYIEDIRLRSFDREQGKLTVRFDVNCGPGTYIRSLVSDIGDTLGCGGCVLELRRTKSGEFSVEDALPFEDAVNKTEDLDHCIIPIEGATEMLPTVVVNAEGEREITCGRPLEKKRIASMRGEIEENAVFRIMSETGRLLALHERVEKEEDVEIISKAIRVISRNEPVENNEVA